MAFVPPFEPDDAATAAAMLAYAAGERMAVAPAGNGTKASAEPRASIAISTSRLTSRLSHFSGDLVATVPAGCTLEDVNAVLGRERQWIPLDPPHETRATIGGIVATNDSGPRRHAFGSPRDLIIGIEVALANGTVARSGGRVVKNVAGYDLGRLFCGSRGSLGVITSVTFKLAPVAPASRTVVARYLRPQHALAGALEIGRCASLTPTAIELASPDPRLLVRFETTERAADLMAGSAAALLAPHSTDVSVLDGADERVAWDRHQHAESRADGFAMTTAVLPASAAALFEELDHIAGTCGVAVSFTGRAALGVFRVRFAGDPDRLPRAAALARTSAEKHGGHSQVTSGLASLAFAVKQRFDPAGVLPWPWDAPATTTPVQA